MGDVSEDNDDDDDDDDYGDGDDDDVGDTYDDDEMESESPVKQQGYDKGVVSTTTATADATDATDAWGNQGGLTAPGGDSVVEDGDDDDGGDDYGDDEEENEDEDNGDGYSDDEMESESPVKQKQQQKQHPKPTYKAKEAEEEENYEEEDDDNYEDEEDEEDEKPSGAPVGAPPALSINTTTVATKADYKVEVVDGTKKTTTAAAAAAAASNNKTEEKQKHMRTLYREGRVLNYTQCIVTVMEDGDDGSVEVQVFIPEKGCTGRVVFPADHRQGYEVGTWAGKGQASPKTKKGGFKKLMNALEVEMKPEKNEVKVSLTPLP